MAQNNEVTGWVGWVYFAGILMVLAGIFQGIAGLTALLNDKFFVVTEENILAFNFTTWGWIHLLLGVVILSAGFAVMNGSNWGRVVGVLLASLSAVANLLFVTAYPVWSIVALLVDVLIIYALVVHGGEAKESLN